MSHDAQSVEELTALYKMQSPSAFIAFAMEGLPDHDHNERYDKGDHEGASKCNYPCCNDKGVCNSWGWHACCIGTVVVLCICCCYATNGFNGVWTYWPF
ncbi:MAG: hypothetical protein IJ856_06345 [Candidatus Methanomethylophilaceae archaeon]|nr:hypothetical protein [Candidatus Methanomethylophilaceae archaeon]